MSNFKIKKNVPLAPIKNKRSGLRITLEKMEIGDYLEVSRDTIHPSNLYLLQKVLNMKFSYRTLNENKRGIWRMA